MTTQEVISKILVLWSRAWFWFFGQELCFGSIGHDSYDWRSSIDTRVGGSIRMVQHFPSRGAFFPPIFRGEPQKISEWRQKLYLITIITWSVSWKSSNAYFISFIIRYYLRRRRRERDRHSVTKESEQAQSSIFRLSSCIFTLSLRWHRRNRTEQASVCLSRGTDEQSFPTPLQLLASFLLQALLTCRKRSEESCCILSLRFSLDWRSKFDSKGRKRKERKSSFHSAEATKGIRTYADTHVESVLTRGVY